MPVGIIARSSAVPLPSIQHSLRSATGGPGERGRRDRRAEAVPSPAPDAAELPVILEGLRVLLVDDDPDITDLFQVALTMCGADVVTADSARRGLDAALAHQPHVVISDIAMRGEDGYWLVKSLRSAEATAIASVPAIAITAFGREHSRSRALLAGFQEHLQKPIDPDVLCRTVARLAGR